MTSWLTLIDRAAGILKSYQVTSDPAMLQTMVDWFDHQFAKGTPSKVREGAFTGSQGLF